MGPTPVYGARAEKPPQTADIAMKQTNICRLIGDIIYRAHSVRTLLIINKFVQIVLHSGSSSLWQASSDNDE